MRAKYKPTGKIYEIFNVRDDWNGNPQFLIRKDNEWVYISAEYFVTIEGGRMKRNILKYIIWFVVDMIIYILLHIFGLSPDIFVWLAVWVTIVLVEYICNHSGFD